FGSGLARGPFSAFVPIIDNLFKIIRPLDRQDAGSGLDFLVRPPRPANVVALDQRDAVPEPLGIVLTAFPQPQRQVILFTQSQEARNGLRRVRIPVLMEAQHEVLVPWTGETVVVVAPAVAFDNQQMVPIDFADGPSDGPIQVPDRLVGGI